MPTESFPLLLHYHPLTIYRKQVLKQADVVMAMYLLGNEFSLDQKKRNFAYYDPLTTGDSSLSASIQSIVAAEIGDEDAACRYLDFALLIDLADVTGNVSHGVHIASAAGGWMGLVFGFGGVRDFDGQLTIDPHLPRRFRSLGFSLRFQDRQIRVRLTHQVETYSLTEGDPLEISIRGTPHKLTCDSTLELAADGSTDRPDAGGAAAPPVAAGHQPATASSTTRATALRSGGDRTRRAGRDRRPRESQEVQP
jgi:alpha,alpha-trehalose phosphorylase